jgi:hypothetical protein
MVCILLRNVHGYLHINKEVGIALIPMLHTVRAERNFADHTTEIDGERPSSCGDDDTEFQQLAIVLDCV